MKNSKKYTIFRQSSNFVMPKLETIDDKIYFNKQLVCDETQKIWETNDFLNIGYNSKNSLSKMLSNLYPTSFKFKGKKVASIEGVLQSLKYKDKKIQNTILKYYGLDAYHSRGANSTDFWGENGMLFWQGKPLNRHSEHYQTFIDELYICASKNPLYKKALLSTQNKYLLHHIGKDDASQTVLTRFEFEQRLNTLRDFLKQENKK